MPTGLLRKLANKNYTCSHCGMPIPKGSYYLYSQVTRNGTAKVNRVSQISATSLILHIHETCPIPEV